MESSVNWYQRAIDEAGDPIDMYDLALLLQIGSDGLEADAPRALDLYSPPPPKVMLRQCMNSDIC